MKKIRIIVAVTLTLLTSILATGSLVNAKGAQDEKFVVSDLSYSSQGFKTALLTEVSKAKNYGLKPIVLFYKNSCRPSMALVDSLNDPLMKDAFQGSYVIKVNRDTWGSQVQSAGFFVSETPTLFHLDGKAQPLAKITSAAWGANIPVNMAPPLKEFVRKVGK